MAPSPRLTTCKRLRSRLGTALACSAHIVRQGFAGEPAPHQLRVREGRELLVNSRRGVVVGAGVGPCHNAPASAPDPIGEGLCTLACREVIGCKGLVMDGHGDVLW